MINSNIFANSFSQKCTDMNKTPFIAIAFMVTSVIVSAQKDETNSFPETTHDFGYVTEGETATHVFTFDNNLEDSIRLKQVRPSCGCTSPHWTKEPVAPGSTGDIKVAYNSNRRPGPFQKRVIVTFENDALSTTLHIKGVVVPDTLSVDPSASSALSFSRDEVSFGRVEKNKTHAKTFTITNTGSHPVNIRDIKTGCKCTSWEMSQTEIASGEDATVEINYSPRTKGKNKDIAVIITDDPGQPVYTITLNAQAENSLIDSNMMQESKNNSFKF